MNNVKRSFPDTQKGIQKNIETSKERCKMMKSTFKIFFIFILDLITRKKKKEKDELVTKFKYTSSFILPCKTNCQPIFLKMQGTYSPYAKL